MKKKDEVKEADDDEEEEREERPPTTRGLRYEKVKEFRHRNEATPTYFSRNILPSLKKKEKR